MGSLTYELQALAEHVVAVYFKAEHSELLRVLIQFQKELQVHSFPGYEEMTTAFHSAAIYFDPNQVWKVSEGIMPTRWVMEWLKERLKLLEFQGIGAAPRTILVPVCYGGEFGPDLIETADRLALTGEELVYRHSGRIYTVQMIGFAPGFPYLTGLDPSLAVPRRAVPRQKVAAGSVGIGGGQTGIYPTELPGGWNIIGATPLRLFMPECDPPILFQAGDKIRFVPITEEEYWNLKQGGEVDGHHR